MLASISSCNKDFGKRECTTESTRFGESRTSRAREQGYDEVYYGYNQAALVVSFAKGYATNRVHVNV
jgi:hypothetical protein